MFEKNQPENPWEISDVAGMYEDDMWLCLPPFWGGLWWFDVIGTRANGNINQHRFVVILEEFD